MLVAAIASAHVVLNKRDVRAAIGWAGLIWLAPLVGVILYWLLGINRIKRRAVRLERPTHSGTESLRAYEEGTARHHNPALSPLALLVARTTGSPLLSGNRVTPLVDGDEAYPAMLQAIARAQRSVLLTTYIFDNDRAGRLFLEALREARGRGAEVRVLVDGVGARYSRPRMSSVLRSSGLPVAEFLAPRLPLPSPYYNLRNHRKILLVDGRIAFTGGMNIREGCLLREAPAHPVQDLHFRLEGPVVEQLFTAGALDWHFTTGETLGGDAWRMETATPGHVEARSIPDGPDEDFDAIRTAMLGALAVARERVRIVTPYFLPDQVLTDAIRLAALRGVELDVVLPERGNLRFVEWASTAQLTQVVQEHCSVWLTPPPFDHTKLMVVDGEWSLLGSANWDARSLRLSFELDVECYDVALAEELEALIERKMNESRRLTRQELAARSLPIQLRDGLARLFSPYL